MTDVDVLLFYLLSVLLFCLLCVLYSTDNLDFVKERATKTIFKLLAAKPEGEQVSALQCTATAGL